MCTPLHYIAVSNEENVVKKSFFKMWKNICPLTNDSNIPLLHFATLWKFAKSLLIRLNNQKVTYIYLKENSMNITTYLLK